MNTFNRLRTKFNENKKKRNAAHKKNYVDLNISEFHSNSYCLVIYRTVSVFHLIRSLPCNNGSLNNSTRFGGKMLTRQKMNQKNVHATSWRKKMEKLKSLKRGKAVGQHIGWKHNKHLKSKKVSPATFQMTLQKNGKNKCKTHERQFKRSYFCFFPSKFITLARIGHEPKSNSIILPNCFSNSISAAIFLICCSHRPNCERQRIIFLRHSGKPMETKQKKRMKLNPNQRHKKSQQKYVKVHKRFSI